MSGEAAHNCGGTLTATRDGRNRHEVRVFPAFDGAGRSVTLRCCCSEAWNLEEGHTTGELTALVAQHAGGMQ